MRVLRNDKREGLMRSGVKGADAAMSEYSLFLILTVNATKIGWNPCLLEL